MICLCLLYQFRNAASFVHGAVHLLDHAQATSVAEQGYAWNAGPGNATVLQLKAMLCVPDEQMRGRPDHCLLAA